MPPTTADVGCSLSEIYLEATSVVAGYPCLRATRLIDNQGIDATFNINDDFGPNSIKDFTLNVQLKHTSHPTILRNGDFSHSLEIATYEKYRETNTSNMYLLVLLILPAVSDVRDWLTCTTKQLSIKGVAYYASIYGLPYRSGQSAAVHYKKRNRFTPERLQEILRAFALGDVSTI